MESSLERLSTLPIDADGYVHTFNAQELYKTDDNNYIQSEFKQFFENYGFAIISEVFTVEECASTRDAMWQILEQANPGFNAKDTSSWDKLKSKGKYGLSLRGPSFHPQLVKNRYLFLLFMR